MNAAINQLTAPDAVTAGSTIDTSRFLDHVNVDVNNQSILWAPKVVEQPGGAPNVATWGNEVAMAPGSRTIRRAGMTGFRFRALTPAGSLPAGSSQAVVTVEAVF